MTVVSPRPPAPDDDLAIPLTRTDASPAPGAVPGRPSGDVPVIEVDLDALCANYRFMRDHAPKSDIAAVVKCDGYGLGAARVAAALIGEGCTHFYVAHPGEGAALRPVLTAAGAPDCVISVFHGPTETSLSLFRDHHLTPVLNTRTQADLWARAMPGVPASLHVDTGMNRLGLPADQIDAVKAIDGLTVTRVLSHLVAAGHPEALSNARQRAAFLQAAVKFPMARLSLAASGGALIDPGYHFSEIRFGISLYGEMVDGPRDDRLQPVARLTAPILQLRDLEAGESAGYDATWTATSPTRLATLAIGYGDGLPRAASNTATVYVGGKACPIVGRVSMDLTIVDVTAVGDGLALGDRAEIFGPAAPLDALARACGTIGYELLTGLGHRVQRRYRETSGCDRKASAPAANPELSPV